MTSTRRYTNVGVVVMNVEALVSSVFFLNSISLFSSHRHFFKKKVEKIIQFLEFEVVLYYTKVNKSD